VPVPDSEIVNLESDALEITATLPLAVPAEVGRKTAPKVKLCPGIRVSGRLSPLRLKPAPVTGAWVTFTLVPPVLVSVSDKVWLLPTCTLPKLSGEVVADSDPGVAPVPESGTERVGLEALLVIVRPPVTDPLD
jgi:hypothetical protein